MDLKEFYFQNIQKTDYHYRFFDAIENVNKVYNFLSGQEEIHNYVFDIYDDEEAIEKFRKLCQPNNRFDDEGKCWFYLITYYLYKTLQNPMIKNQINMIEPVIDG